MLPKELKDTNITTEYIKGGKVLHDGLVKEVLNIFPLNEAEFIYKVGTLTDYKWIEGKRLCDVA
jgi:hypothetical protein